MTCIAGAVVFLGIEITRTCPFCDIMVQLFHTNAVAPGGSQIVMVVALLVLGIVKLAAYAYAPDPAPITVGLIPGICVGMGRGVEVGEVVGDDVGVAVPAAAPPAPPRTSTEDFAAIYTCSVENQPLWRLPLHC